ncbi:MAG: hypothetical protein CML17_11860 [Pusillimonas sp.]|nr:hypothetical protein [Pusillimonas sp.]
MANVTPNVQLMGFSYHDLDRFPDPSQQIDVLLISIASPERLTSLVTAGLRAFLPQKVVLLAEGAPDYDVLRALPKQVAGFIDQSAPADVFVDSVRRVLAGRTCFPWDQSLTSAASDHVVHKQNANEGAAQAPTVLPDVLPKTEPALNADSTSSATAAKTNAPLINEAELLGLTRRQYEVLVLLSQGHALKSVARILDISLGTTKAHTESVYQRLGAHNRNQAVYLARSKGATLEWVSVAHTNNSVDYVPDITPSRNNGTI